MMMLFGKYVKKYIVLFMALEWLLLIDNLFSDLIIF